jgi:hypothetical protein
LAVISGLTKFSVRIIAVAKYYDGSGKKKTYQAKNHPGKRRRKMSFFSSFPKPDSLAKLSYQRCRKMALFIPSCITLAKALSL